MKGAWWGPVFPLEEDYAPATGEDVGFFFKGTTVALASAVA